MPTRYSQTVVKILAQTPKMLFVYWDISEEDRNNYIAQYGEDFFNNTVPFLRVKNQTENYTFEVDVDDFANSWYLPINDAKSTLFKPAIYIEGETETLKMSAAIQYTDSYTESFFSYMISPI